MRTREYRETDESLLRQLLREEGVSDEHHDFTDAWVVEDEKGLVGFFSFYKGDELNIGHFLVDKERRHGGDTIDMCLECLDKAKEKGAKRLIVHSRLPYISRFVERTFKANMYAQNDGYDFYALEV